MPTFLMKKRYWNFTETVKRNETLGVDALESRQRTLEGERHTSLDGTRINEPNVRRMECVIFLRVREEKCEVGNSEDSDKTVRRETAGTSKEVHGLNFFYQ